MASNFDSEKDDFPPAPNVHPVAVLNLYEAYFLSLVGGCLDIWDGISGKPIDPGDLMGVLCSIRPLFPYYFAAYHHFRKLKYVVHSGLKFGTDFGESVLFRLVTKSLLKDNGHSACVE